MTFELKLTDIELNNFRLFDKVKVVFDDKLTLFISENGAGKTALLEGIMKALRVVTERLAHDNTDLNKGVYDVKDIKNDNLSCATEIHLLSKVDTEGATAMERTIGWRLLFNRKNAVVKVEKDGNDTFLDDITQQTDEALTTKQPHGVHHSAAALPHQFIKCSMIPYF